MNFSINNGESDQYISKNPLHKHLRNYFRTRYRKFIPQLVRECNQYRVVQIHWPHGHFYSQEYVEKIKEVASLAPRTYFWVVVRDTDHMYDYSGPENFIPVFYGSKEYAGKFAHVVSQNGDFDGFICDEKKPNCQFCLRCMTDSKVILRQ